MSRGTPRQRQVHTNVITAQMVDVVDEQLVSLRSGATFYQVCCVINRFQSLGCQPKVRTWLNADLTLASGGLWPGPWVWWETGSVITCNTSHLSDVELPGRRHSTCLANCR